MPSLNKTIQRLKAATIPLDLPCSGPVTHSGEISTTGKSHGKKPDGFNILTLISSTCFEAEGSSSGRQMYVQVRYSVFFMHRVKQCEPSGSKHVGDINN
jgi:hypothetical protein